MSATGRDIEDMELTLDFSDCRWSRGCSPEQLQMLQLLPALQRLLADKAFSGTATELTARLGDEGNLWGPAQLSRYLQSHEDSCTGSVLYSSYQYAHSCRTYDRALSQ